MTQLRQSLFSHQGMLQQGTDGLEPVPSNNERQDGAWHAERRVTQPIEVEYDHSNDCYTVYAGNDSVAQAKSNGQPHILAFVAPDPTGATDHIGRHARLVNQEPEIAAATSTEPFRIPAQAEIVDILREHQLIRLREKPLRAFVVGSQAQELLGVGKTHAQSDVDILLEVVPRKDESDLEMADRYRRRLQQYFVTHDIVGKDDSVHPQWCGRRVDVYFTYDADLESRPKIELDSPATKRKVRPC